MMLPLDDAGEFSRVHIAAEDALAKRFIIRMAGAGERITVHTRNIQRWASVRMPDITVSDQPKPVSGTTVSVVDGTLDARATAEHAGLGRRSRRAIPRNRQRADHADRSGDGGSSRRPVKCIRWRSSCSEPKIATYRRNRRSCGVLISKRWNDDDRQHHARRRTQAVRSGDGIVRQPDRQADGQAGYEAAGARFREATEIDSSMADAWLGRIATGDETLSTVQQLYTYGARLHRETNRLGVRLSAPVKAGPYLSISVTEASHAGLALASALIDDRQYEKAEALLADASLLDTWENHQWRQYIEAYLMFATQRWPDVISVAAAILPPQAIIMSAVTAATCTPGGARRGPSRSGPGGVGMDRPGRAARRTGRPHRVAPPASRNHSGRNRSQ